MMRHPTSICFVYFKTLTLHNLEASLLTVSLQDMSNVDEVVILDNDSDDDLDAIRATVDMFRFPVTVRLLSLKHGDSDLTHAWSTNHVISQARSRWIFFTRADYLLSEVAVERMLAVLDARPVEWNGFVTAQGYHLGGDISACEQLGWREHGVGMLRDMSGSIIDYTKVDSGVWLSRREAFLRVGGLDERLTAWGHAQTHFQHKLHASGTEFIQVPDVQFYHPIHAAPRDIRVANEQLSAIGADLKSMWDRNDGRNPYR